MYETEPRRRGTCAVNGCERDASGHVDSNGDLCGDHRTAEHALGREAVPTAPRDIGHDEQAVDIEIRDGWPYVVLRNGRTLGPYFTDGEANAAAKRFGLNMTLSEVRR